MRRYCALSHLDVTDTGANRSGAKAVYVPVRCVCKIICSHLLAAVEFRLQVGANHLLATSKAVGWLAGLTGE